jgi:hypothetical protein
MLTVVQRFKSDRGLYVHPHLLASDGVWHELPGGDVVFRPVTELREVDLLRVLDEVAADLATAGVLDDELDIDTSLAACIQLSLSTPPSPGTVTVACWADEQMIQASGAWRVGAAGMAARPNAPARVTNPGRGEVPRRVRTRTHTAAVRTSRPVFTTCRLAVADDPWATQEAARVRHAGRARRA